MDTPGDGSQAFGPMVNGVHAGHDGQQNLGGADIARRLVPADMLLPGLNRQPVGQLARAVPGDAHHSPRHLAGVLFGGDQVGGMGAPETDGNPKALGRPHRDIGSKHPRAFDQGEGQQVRGHHNRDSSRPGPGDARAGILDAALGARVLEQKPAQIEFVEGCGFRVAQVQRHAQGFGPGAHDLDRLGVAVRGDEKAGALAAMDTSAHAHGLGGGGGFVEERGVGQWQPGEIGHHCLKDQQRFQAALGNLGLVGGVLGIPTGVLENAALDDPGHDDAGIAHAQPRPGGLVFLGHGFQLAQKFGLAQGAMGQAIEGKFFFASNMRRDRRIGECVQGVEAQGLEHLLSISGSGTDMARGEGV